MINPAELRFPAHWVGAIYQAMCVAFPPDLIREFWESHRAVDGKRLPLVQLFKHLMDRHATVPAAYDYAVTNSLELFLHRHDINPEEFVRFASYMSSYHPFYSPEQILFRATKPLVSKLASLYDPRRAVISFLQHVADSVMPGHITRSLKAIDKRTHIITLQYPGVERFPFEHDYHFYCRIQVVNAPSVFGYPPFTRWEPLADARSVEQCLKAGEHVVVDGARVLVNGKCYGTVIPSFIQACAERLDLSLARSGPRDRPAVLMERSYRCPVRGRVVLAEGCMYDAPFYLARIGYDPIPVNKEDYVRSLFTLVKNADRIADKKVVEVHAALTASPLRLVYTAAEQRFDVFALDQAGECEPRMLMSLSGTEARILRCLVLRQAADDLSAAVRCLDIAREVYAIGPQSRLSGHRSFYVSLKRLMRKMDRLTPANLRLRTVSSGRSKSVELRFFGGRPQYVER